MEPRGAARSSAAARQPISTSRRTPPTRHEATRSDHRHPPACHRFHRSRLLAWGIPLLFLGACIGLFASALWFLKPEPTVENQVDTPPSSIGSSSSTGLWPVEAKSDLPHEPGGGMPSDRESASLIAEAHGPGSASAAVRATAVVQDFLDATGLDERMPLIISRRSQEQLAQSSLAGELPGHSIPKIERQISIPRELLTEFYFTVKFPEAPAPHPRKLAVLVHQRGHEAPPRILADPFIDLFDGGVREFGAEPLDGFRTFHVLAEPVSVCTDLVPDPDKKITLRLRSHENGDELASAYTRKISEIGEMLNQPRSSLRWGQAHPCVVTVQWNREIPEQPFLELIRLDAITWNQ